MNQVDFLAWEQASRDTIDVKRCYIDLAGDLIAGHLLSQIVYWHLPGHNGIKLRVERDGHLWLAKGREDWWNEIRISARQFDRACAILETRDLIETALFQFAGAPTKHLRIKWDTFLSAIAAHQAWTDATPDYVNLPKRQNPFYRNGKIDFTDLSTSYTETTAETTAETKKPSADESAREGSIPNMGREQIEDFQPVTDITKGRKVAALSTMAAVPADDWLTTSRIKGEPLDIEELTDAQKAAIATPAPESRADPAKPESRWVTVMRAAHQRFNYPRDLTFDDDIVPLIERFSHESGIQPPDLKSLSKKWHAGTVTLLCNFDTQLSNGTALSNADRRALIHWCIDVFFTDDNPVSHITASSPHSLITAAGNLVAFLHEIQDWFSLGRAGRPTLTQVGVYLEHNSKGGQNGHKRVVSANAAIREEGTERADREAKAAADARRAERLANVRDGG